MLWPLVVWNLLCYMTEAADPNPNPRVTIRGVMGDIAIGLKCLKDKAHAVWLRCFDWQGHNKQDVQGHKAVLSISCEPFQKVCLVLLRQACEYQVSAITTTVHVK